MLRRATADDIPDLVELQALLFTEMGQDQASTTCWRKSAAEWLADHLGLDACVYVVDDGGRW